MNSNVNEIRGQRNISLYMNGREILFNNRKEYFLGKEKVVAEKFRQPSYYQHHAFRSVKRYHIL
jgi:hypothetical protein